MTGRFCLYVEVDADTVGESIIRACRTIGDEQRWPIRVTGVHYGPDVVGVMPGLIGPVSGPAEGSSPLDEQNRLMAEFLEVAKKQLKQQKRGDDWQQGEDEL